MLNRFWTKKLAPLFSFFAASASMLGCTQTTFLKYSEFVEVLDGKSEAAVSTYPAHFPNQTEHIPYLYRELVTFDKLYFQVFIRDADKKVGKNPHIQSIKIHSFSYQVEGQKEVQLIKDYDSNFWSQDQNESSTKEAFAFRKNSEIKVSLSLTLNDQDYSLSGTMKPVTYTKWAPLLYFAFQ